MRLSEILDAYLLTHEVEVDTADHYRRCVNVLVTWAGMDILASKFTSDLLNRFLQAKQEAGRASYYRKSLRNVLGAILRFHCGGQMRGTLRPVKLEELEPESWTPEEIGGLVAACDTLPQEKRSYWRTLIPAGYYTGLERVDLQRLWRKHIAESGAIHFARHKTGKRVLVWMPLELVSVIDATRPQDAPLWAWEKSAEWFRRQFGEIVEAAGLSGSFKRLRKTSGTWVDIDFPGRGHSHLGHDRKIFETHYRDRRQYPSERVMPRMIQPPRGREAG